MSRRVLIVEDDLLQQQALADVLRTKGFYIETTSSGLDAVKKAKIGWFDLILMDYRLADTDGLAAARVISTIKSNGRRPKIIGLTGTPEHLLAWQDKGEKLFSAIERKPYQFGDLVETIENVLEEDADSLEACAWPDMPFDQVKPVTEAIGEKGRVLVVEDDDITRQLASMALTEAGHMVESVSDGVQAFAMISAGDFDAVVLDQTLPGLDGLSAAQLTHACVAYAIRPRLIAWTANPEQITHRESTMLPSFDHIVVKSDGIGALLHAVQLSLFYKKGAVGRETVRVSDIISVLDMADAASSSIGFIGGIDIVRADWFRKLPVG